MSCCEVTVALAGVQAGLMAHASHIVDQCIAAHSRVVESDVTNKLNNYIHSKNSRVNNYSMMYQFFFSVDPGFEKSCTFCHLQSPDGSSAASQQSLKSV